MSRSPRCGERNASRPRATQNVLLSCAPAATTGRARGDRQRHGAGREPARAPKRELRADDRILAAAVDRPVVGEERVGDVAECGARVVVVEGDRLVGAVPARQHERPSRVGRQEVVERRVREHHAEPLASGRNRLRDSRVLAPPQEHDRRRPLRQQLPLGRLDVRERVRVGGHDRERLVLAHLPRPESRDRVVVRRVAGEVVAAEALDRDDRAVEEEAHRVLERHREPRAADGARDRLGVEAPVRRVLVLAPAVGAELERRHRRPRAVVRDVDDDREPRATLRAVRERVPVAAVGRVEQLAQAVVAGRDVGGDERRAAGRGALGDREGRLADGLDRHGDDAVDARERRRLVPQAERERVERRPSSLRLHDDAVAVVQDEPDEAVGARQAVHERPEADALDDPGHAEPPPLDPRNCCHGAIVAHGVFSGRRRGGRGRRRPPRRRPPQAPRRPPGSARRPRR